MKRIPTVAAIALFLLLFFVSTGQGIVRVSLMRVRGAMISPILATSTRSSLRMKERGCPHSIQGQIKNRSST